MTSSDLAVGNRTDAERCRELLRRWDAQQEVYARSREAAYTVMFEILDDLLEGDITVLDLACGPGSIGQRFLQHRPRSHAVAVDVDPVLLTLGRHALGDMDEHLSWVHADLRDPDWASALGDVRVDAVLSSTALHWLDPAALARVYADLAELLPEGGVVLNYDGFRLPDATTPLARAVDRVDRRRQDHAVATGADAWLDWWDAAAQVPVLAEQFPHRAQVLNPIAGRRFSGATKAQGATAELHQELLRAAGFSDVGSVWQDLHKRVVAAVR